MEDAVTILCAALYAARQDDKLVRDAADVLCRDYRTVTQLGEAIADGHFSPSRGSRCG